MDRPQGKDAPPTGGKSLGRTLLRWLLPFALLAAAAVLLLKFAIGPHLVRTGLLEAVGPYWQGRVDVGRCEYNFSAPQYVWHDLTLRDSRERPWLRITRLDFHRDSSPAGGRYHAIAPTVNVYVGSDVSPPWLLGAGATLTREAFPAVHLSDATVAIASTPAFDGDMADLMPSGGADATALEATLENWGASLSWPAWSPGPLLSAVGPDGLSALTGIYLASDSKFAIPAGRLAQLDLTVLGRLLNLDDLHFSGIDVYDDAVEVGGFACSLLDGRLSGRGSVQTVDGHFEFNARAEDMDLAALSRLADGDTAIEGVCERADLALSYLTGVEKNPTGSLDMALRDVKSSGGILEDFLKAVQLRSQDEQNRYRIICRADMAYPDVKLLAGRMTSPALSMALQSGSVNLQTHRIDAYLILGVFDGDGGLLAPITDSLSTLTRVHIDGPWDAPMSELVGKEPVKDVAGAVVDLFSGIVNLGTGAVTGLGRAAGNAAGGIGDLVMPEKKTDDPSATPATPATPAAPDESSETTRPAQDD